MSPVDDLREAARLLRERAEAATKGPWTVQHAGDSMSFVVWSESPDIEWRYQREVMTVHSPDPEWADCTYIASMHPLVGLALADLLDGYANVPPFAGWGAVHGKRLVALARAILREPS